MSYFPMYMELEGKDCLVIGSNLSAYRKIKVMQEFGARVKVISPKISDKIRELDGILWEERMYLQQDLEMADVVIASTGNADLNHEISMFCRAGKIPVNAVDQIEDCTFIFPSYIKRGEVVASFSSGGKSPVITQYLKTATEPIMTEHLGAMADCLGALRQTVRECVATESERKAVYQEILQMGLESEKVPSEAEIARIIERYTKDVSEG